MSLTSFLVVAFLLMISTLITLIRISVGPTVGDRLVGLDTMNTLVVALMVILGVVFDTVVYVDVAIVYALLSFIGTLFVAKYLREGS